MAFSKEELKQIGDVVVEVTTPMFEHVIEKIDGLERRMDRVETRIESLEHELSEFKSEVNSRFAEIDARFAQIDIRFAEIDGRFADMNTRFNNLEQKLDDQTLSIGQRLEYMEEDVQYLYKLVDMLDHGSPEEKRFAKLTIEKQVPIIYRSLQAIAKKAGIALPKA